MSTHTPLSSILLVMTASFFGSIGSVFLKAGAGRLHRRIHALLRALLLISAGVMLFLVSSYFFVLGIRQGELSVLYPMVSLAYFFTLIWARLFFGEPFTRNKIVGLLLILIGILMLGIGKSGAV